MSSQETTDNFWQVWASFVWPDPAPVSYRCYYQDDGTVDFYAMEHLPGNYIEVEQHVYVLAPMPARVIDGQLIILKPKTTVQKLKPATDQGTQCHCQDVSVVVNTNGTYWNYQTNEIN
jgi:hypothetical protein